MMRLRSGRLCLRWDESEAAKSRKVRDGVFHRRRGRMGGLTRRDGGRPVGDVDGQATARSVVARSQLFRKVVRVEGPPTR